MTETEEIVEGFHGVYLLYSLCPRHVGKVYIGYTTNPSRRLHQHNQGIACGGAKKTNYKRPWRMVLVVHGFPNGTTALQFEWAWQNPTISKRLKNIDFKRPRHGSYDYHLRILSEMLQLNPWKRLPLIIRWIDKNLTRRTIGNRVPPLHMPICHGPLNVMKLAKPAVIDQAYRLCTVCDKFIEPGEQVRCVFDECRSFYHIICLSKSFLAPGEYVPLLGKCPSCDKICSWGAIIRKFHGYSSENTVKIIA